MAKIGIKRIRIDYDVPLEHYTALEYTWNSDNYIIEIKEEENHIKILWDNTNTNETSYFDNNNHICDENVGVAGVCMQTIRDDIYSDSTVTFEFDNDYTVKYRMPDQFKKIISEFNKYINSDYTKLPTELTNLERAAELLDDNDEFDDI